MKKFIRNSLILLFLLTIVGDEIPAYTYNEYNNYPYSNNSYYSQRQPSDLYKENVKSMVYVKTQDRQGSGVIVQADGTFVTCFHIIADADYIKVQMNDGSVYNVTGFKYINPIDDIAVLTIDSQRTFSPIWINTGGIKIGERVYTISNPQGLQFVFSDGMVNQYSDEYIQFSASVSRGSSGGALLNERGELLGIITSLFKESQNINFALPNQYYLSKLYNPVIRNNENLKWTDFVVKNASESQFRLYAEYALMSKDFTMIYKYIKPFVNHKEFPADAYALAGFYAFYTFIESDDIVALNDAIKWYEKSIIHNVNIEASLLALTILYIFQEQNEKIYSVYTRLENYPYTFKLFTESANKIARCGEKDISCYADSMEGIVTRLTELTRDIAKRYYQRKGYY